MARGGKKLVGFWSSFDGSGFVSSAPDREEIGSSANGVDFVAAGGRLDVLRGERQGVFLSCAGAFGTLAG